MRQAMLIAVLILFCSSTGFADQPFQKGGVGDLQYVNPELNTWYHPSEWIGRKIEVIADGKIFEKANAGYLFLPNGVPVARLDFGELSEAQIAELRDSCPEYIFCIGRWGVELTGKEDRQYGEAQIVKLRYWRR